MKARILISIIIVCLNMGNLFAQNPKLKKADQEFDNYAYIDARKIYMDVVKDGYESAQIFKKLGDTYYFNSEYTEAAEWYNRLAMRYPNEMEPKYYYRYAQTLKSIDQYEASEKMMQIYQKNSNGNEQSKYSLGSLMDSARSKYNVVNATEGTKGSDFGPTFYGDKIVYATSSENTRGVKTDDWTGLPFLDLYESDLDSIGKFKNPSPLKGDINSPYHESSAVFTKDGNTVYFTRNNYINGKKKRDKERLVSLKIYKGTKNENGTWTDIIELPFNNDSYSVAHPALSLDGKRLYFSSNMPGSLGNSDLWYVDILDDGNYGKPINLGNQINTVERESFPFISEENNLYFSSDGHLGLGGLDIFVVSLDSNGTYSKVANLKMPINTNKDDFGFIINENLKSGYLSSNRDGEEGSVSDDIYAFYENCLIVVEGVVTDANTSEPLRGAKILLLDKDNQLLEEQITTNDGSYVFTTALDCDEQYAIRATYDELEYQPQETALTTPNGTLSINLDFALIPPDCPVNDLGCRLTLQPIYFDFDKHHIRKDAEVELAKILQAMKTYPQLSIHIESHTDARGNDAYNTVLSEKRAKSTLEWLVSHGIERSRLSAKGYGETQLLNSCSNGVKCSEEEHQLNRRSTFIIKN